MSNETTISSHPTSTARQIRVWDLPVRLFHWLLLGLVVTLFITAELLDDAIDLHARAGYAVLALVSFRLLWGFVGGTYARFTQFLTGPVTALHYARTLFNKRPHFVAGHNPLGGWMVVALLMLLLVQAALGLFTNDDLAFEGPLFGMIEKETSDLLTGLHKKAFDLLFVLVALHVAAVAWHKVFKGENLVIPMFTGKKELPPGYRADDAQGGNPLLAAVLLATCGAVVYWIVV